MSLDVRLLGRPVKGIRTATLTEALEFLAPLKVVAADTETTGLHPYFDQLLLLSFGNKHRQYVVDVHEQDPTPIIESLRDRQVLFHNANFDWKFIKRATGIGLPNIGCTMLAAGVVHNGRGVELSLANLTKRYLNKVLDKGQRGRFTSMKPGDPFAPEDIIYSASDVEMLVELAKEIMAEADEYDVYHLAKKEWLLVPVLCSMELAGIPIDVEKLTSLTRQQEIDLAKLESDMDSCLAKYVGKYPLLKPYVGQRTTTTQIGLFGEDRSSTLSMVSYKSPKQMAEIFDAVHLPMVSTGHDELARVVRTMVDTPAAEFAGLLLEHRAVSKRLGTYGDNLLGYINPITNNIHTRYTQVFTRTGRLSSGDETITVNNKRRKLGWYINFQNIPKLQEYRSCFRVPSDEYRYITIDMSGAEIAIAASHSQDKVLLQSQNEGLDLHSTLASVTFSIIEGKEVVVTDEHTPDLRQAHKPVLFGLFYGAGASRIADLLDIDRGTAQQAYDAIRQKLPGLFEYQDTVANQALKLGYVIANDVTQRRRWFPKWQRDKAPDEVRREASNFPIQATNADMIKDILVALHSYLEDKDAWLVNTVHDEVSIIAHHSIAEMVYNDAVTIICREANKYLRGVVMKAKGKIDTTWTK